MRICPKCAAHNDDKTHLCPVCGTRLLSGPPGGSGPVYPVPVDPWAAHADTQTVMSPFDHTPTPTSGPPAPTSGSGPASGGTPTSGTPAFLHPTSVPPATSGGPTMPPLPPTRPFAGAIVPAPQPPTQPVTQYPTRPATIEVTQRSGVPLRWVSTIAAVVVVGVGVAAAIVVPRLLADNSSNGGKPTPTTAAESSSPGPAPSSAAPDEGGLVVAIAPDLNDGRADDVVAMLDVYFNGINAKDYDAVGSVLDEDGTTDPRNLADMKNLADGTKSTKNSKVTLTSLDDAGSRKVAAEVTFQSNQNPGDGPQQRPSETCTQWDIIYTLNLTKDNVYKILNSDAASEPC